MPLTPGTRIGAYEIVSPLGEGGMGEVYRARDTTLGRDVALKILPESFANDPDRVMRFEREAKSLAALNHPNIAAIYGIEKSPNRTTQALVMELVEGRDLSELIGSAGAEAHALRQTRIPLDEALSIARQIAAALEAAHEQGIIHRDLKPANIKVKDDGAVKVLDFGLAKQHGAARATPEMADLKVTPYGPDTDASTVLGSPTAAGMVLGTAAYMSPEQAAGKPVDRRSDIWAFGVVLLEMLTGRRTFQGETVSHVIAAVLKDAPDFSTLPADTPSSIRTLLRRCLEKDRKKRLDSAAAARLEIDDALSGASEVAVAGPAPVVPFRQRTLPWAIAAVLAIIALGTLVVSSPWKMTAVPMPRKFEVAVGAGASLELFSGNAAALSPDGTTMVFLAEGDGTRRLFVRQLDQLEAVAMPGTEGASGPFFSTDSRKVGFFALGSIKSVFVTGGGAALPIAEVGSLASAVGSWDVDDTIFYAGLSGPVMRVPPGGGTPEAFGTLSEGATSQRAPQVLPGGAGVLCTETLGSPDNTNLVVIPPEGGAPITLLKGGYFGRYLPGGYLVYMRDGTLFGVRFDLGTLDVVGESIPVLQDVQSNRIMSVAQLAFSDDGTVVYIQSAGQSVPRALDWTTRNGVTSPLMSEKVIWGNPSFSPDGEKLAMSVNDGTQSDIWVYELKRNRRTQITFDSGDEVYPVWSPDGRQIVFFSSHDDELGSRSLRIVNADGTEEKVVAVGTQLPFSWRSDGTALAVMEPSGHTLFRISMIAMTRNADQTWTAGQSTEFFDSPGLDATPQFSPDGEWVAYVSDKDGTGNVYVKPFRGAGGPWNVSNDGGQYPRWSKTAKELLFLGPEGKVLSTTWSVEGGSFYAAPPQTWTPTLSLRPGGSYSYDIHADGERLALAAVEQKDVIRDHVVVMNNFFDYVKRIVDGNR